MLLAGLYCQLQVDNVLSSYTVIPNGDKPNLIQFKVRSCVITEKFRKMVGADLRHMHYTGGSAGHSTRPLFRVTYLPNRRVNRLRGTGMLILLLVTCLGP